MKPLLRLCAPLLFGLSGLLLMISAQTLAPQAFERLRNAGFDTYQRLFPWNATDETVIVVDIDDESLKRHGQWPWPRNMMARIIGELQQEGASSIGLDIVFSEPDRTSPRTLARTWQDIRGASVLTPDMISGLPDYDEDMARTIAGGRVVTGFALRPEETAGDYHTGRTIGIIGSDPVFTLPGFRGMIPNLRQFDAGSAGSGTFSVSTGRDDVIRRIPVLLGLNQTIVPSLALEVMRVAEDEETVRVRSDRIGETLTGYTVRVGSRTIPLATDGTFWLHHGAFNPDSIIPAWQILDPERRQEFARKLAGKLVLVGTSATGLADLRPTPLTPFEPGVNLHARALQQIMAGHFLIRPVWAEALEVPLSALVASLIVVLTAFLRLRRSLPVFLITLSIILVAPPLAFTQVGVLVDASFPFLAVTVSFAVTLMARTLITERAAARLRTAFTHYLSPSLVATLAKDPDKLALGGELREMTFLFTDLEGFTSLVESQKPEEIVDLLNSYLDGMSGIVMDHGGTIDKIVGDALHVMFNAPVYQQDHASRAIRCAMALDAFAESFKAQQTAMGIAFGTTRIGVNTGMAVVGNFGGAHRFDYTAHGDAINTSARLEAANKGLGTRILLAASTVSRTSGFVLVPVGSLMLRGKSQGVEVFTVPTYCESPPLWLETYSQALHGIGHGEQEGIRALEDLHQAHPQEPVLRLHVERIRKGEVSRLITI